MYKPCVDHINNNKLDNNNIRFTKVLTKYSTEYNNIEFIYDLCKKMDMDKKDLMTFFQESFFFSRVLFR